MFCYSHPLLVTNQLIEITLVLVGDDI